MTSMRKQRRYWKGSSIPISLDGVLIQFRMKLQHSPVCSHTPDRYSSRTPNIPKWQLLVSVPHSALLPLVKDFVLNPPTSWRFEPESALKNTVSLRALKTQTPRLHNLATFHPLKAWKNLRNFFSNQTLFGSHTQSRGWWRQFSISKNCSQSHLQGPNVTKSASVTLQIGINQSSAAPTIYRKSKSPSSIAGWYSESMQLIPVT